MRRLDERPLYGGTLVVPRWPDLVTCNPALSTDLTVHGVLGNVFDGLVRQNVDIELFNQRVLYGSGFPTMSFLALNHPDYNPALEPYPYQPVDRARAEEMLDTCGYPRGPDGYRFDLRLSYDTRPQRVDMAEFFRQQVEEIGIRVVMEGGDYSVWLENTYMKHDYDVTVGSLGLTEPAVGAARLHRSTNIGAAEFNNSSAYVNAEIDALWDTYASSFDPQVRRNAIHQIQAILLEDLPYLHVNFSVYPSA